MTLKRTVSRRDVLHLSAGLVLPSLVGCRPTEARAAPEGGPLQCSETHDQIEGPYYRPGAPERWDLVDPGMRGTLVEIDGRVTTARDCRSALRDVELDVWQATADGHYDNDGSFGLPPPARMVLRGKLRTDARGAYHLRTIVPGHYLNGSQYRPAHVHMKLRAAGFRELTTQLYFPGDPYNAIDPFLHPSLIMAVERASAGLKARYDFALREL